MVVCLAVTPCAQVGREPSAKMVVSWDKVRRMALLGWQATGKGLWGGHVQHSTWAQALGPTAPRSRGVGSRLRSGRW